MGAANVGRRAGVAQGFTVVIGAFLPIMAIVSMFPAVPSLIDHFHADPTAGWKVPWMVTAPGLAIGIVAPFAGYLVDKFGRRKLALWATFFYGLIGSAPFFLDNLNQIFISRILLGVCEGVIMTTFTTLIADYWDEEGRRHWLTVQGIVGPIFAAFLILGSGFLTAVRWNGVFVVYLIAFPIYLSMLFCMFEPASDRAARAMLGMDEEPLEGKLPVRTLLSIIVVTLVASVIYYVYSVNGGMAFREVGITSSSDLGKLTFLPSMVVVFGSIVFWFMGRAPSWTKFLGVYLFLGFGLLGIGLAPNWKIMIAALCVQQVGAGMAVPVLLAWAQRILPFEHRGRGMGVWTACFFLGQFISPPVIAIVHAELGTVQAAFTATGIVALVCAVVAVTRGLTARHEATPALKTGVKVTASRR